MTYIRHYYDEGNHLYYVQINCRGDVEALCGEDNIVRAKYRYGSWENLIGTYDYYGDPITSPTHVGNINPIRYRGYFYDSETGFYYLQSRYYDPEIGRFISMDDVSYLGADGTVLSYNSFAYCGNNPVNLSDLDGNWPSWASKIAIGIGAIVIGAAVVAATAATGGVAAAFIGAAVSGLKAAVISGAIGAVVDASTSAVSHRIATGSWSGAGKAALDGAVDGFANGFMTGGIMAGVSQVSSGIFKFAAKAGVKTGVNGGIKNTGILSPNRLRSVDEIAKIGKKGQRFYDYGGQLFRIGGTKLDMTSKMFLHMHTALTGASHIPVGIVGSGIYGGLR